MMKAVRVGDIGTDHDGFPPTPVTAGSPNVKFDGIPAARVGDPLEPHDKPKHPPHGRVIASGSSTVFINGAAAAITGGAISCGGISIGGGTVNIGDAPSTGNSLPLDVGVAKRVTQVFFSYGSDSHILSEVSRHYTDVNVHAKTVGYLSGEAVSIILTGVVNKTVIGYVDERGEVCIADVFKDSRLEFEGKVM
ncbi:type VI secretion system PAAR protein [Vibrio mimicus]|uniref:type VI secretion system PAAR protein n=1 Tax=Vibrio mimicus TaxID=674 RepID=UPI00292A437A|nr:type VI secretion system PAAR protein [Vibrio mimicus]